MQKNKVYFAKIIFKRSIKGTLVVPLGFEQEIPAHELGAHLVNGMVVEIRREAE